VVGKSKRGGQQTTTNLKTYFNRDERENETANEVGQE